MLEFQPKPQPKTKTRTKKYLLLAYCSLISLAFPSLGRNHNHGEVTHSIPFSFTLSSHKRIWISKTNKLIALLQETHVGFKE